MKFNPTLLLPLALVLTFGCSGAESTTEAASPEAASTPEMPAKSAPTSTYEGPSLANLKTAGVDEVVEIRTTLLNDTTDLLKGVTDVESAKAALPSLDAITGMLGPLGAREDELKDGSVTDKMAYAKSLVTMLGDATGFSAEVTRIAEIPGVTEVLQSGIDQLMAYFTPGK